MYPQKNTMRGTQYMYVDRPKRYSQYTIYRKGPYSQQCPSGGDEEGLLVIHGVSSAWEIKNNLNEWIDLLLLQKITKTVH